MSRRQYQYLFWFALVALVMLSLLPLTMKVSLGYQDKVQHGVAYAALYFLSIRAYSPRWSLWLLAAFFVLFGIAIEFAQSWTEHRQTDVLDMLANTSGVVMVAVLMGSRLLNREPPGFEKN